MNNSRSSLPSSSSVTQPNPPPPTPPTSSTHTSFHHQHLSINASSRSSAITTHSIATNLTTSSYNQLQSSNLSIDMPVATSSVVNKTASRSASLYQNCLEARSLMKRVPGFEQGPWITAEPSNIPPPYSSSDLPSDPHPPLTPHFASTPNQEDPVTQTLDIIRLGSSLCYLYNAILNDHITPPDIGSLPPLPPGKTWTNIKPLKVVWSPREDLKGCQKSAAHFIMALKTELGWGTEIDETQENGLMVNMLYNSNTNATVKVISNVLRLLHLLKSLGVLLPPTEDDLTPLNNELNLAMDDRARVVKEILESERKYVQDLEVLQNYQRALHIREILPSDQIRALFINLDSLVDFQRRFLIGVESNARLPSDEQRFGLLFTNLEDGFCCYEPFCANFASASQLAQDENAALTQVADILDPNYELPTFLIKPVQRICKYPLLLQQLVKHSDPSGPYYSELKEGLASITRVTDAVNETTRQRENELAVNDLKERVEDWKGHDLVQFGQLVLEDTFTVVKNDSEREYHVYLFERIILCCKEVGLKLDKKSSKQSMSLKKTSQVHNNPNFNPGKRKNTQQLKGRIFIANVMSATPRPVPPGAPSHQYLLQVTWRGDISEEYFSIKCRTEEQLKKWQAAITKAVDDAVERRRRQVHHLSSGSRSKMNSPLSQFPNTPQSEMGQPPNSASYSHHLGLQHPRIPEHPYAHSSHGNGGGSISSRTFEDEEDNYQTDVDGSTNGRNTPSGSRRTAGHRSMPAERSETSFGPGRARAQTDDAASANLAQWRNQMPSGSIPPIPRSGQVTPATTDAYMPSSLRSSTSSKQLRHLPSHEWGSGSATGSSSGFNRSDDPSSRAPLPNPLFTHSGYSTNRHGETNHLTTQPSNNPAGIPMFRSRSASSPNIHQSLDPPQKWSSNGIPNVPSLPTAAGSKTHTSGSRNAPVSNSSIHHMGHIKERSSDSAAAAMTDRSSSESHRLSAGMNGAGRSLAGAAFSTQISQSPQAVGSVVVQQHRNSSGTAGIAMNPAGSSSMTPRNSGSLVVVQGTGGTEVSGHHARLSGSTLATVSGTAASTTATSMTFPGTLSLNSMDNNKSSHPTSVRYKLRAGEDTYVIVTLSTVTHSELIEKIYKKLKNCGVLKESSSKLKIRYEDEEGDLILICNDEDVAMAIDWMKSVGISHLLLFVD